MRHVLLIISLIAICLTAAADEIPRDSVIRPDHKELTSMLEVRHRVTTPVLPDSADVTRPKHKAFWRASAEVVGTNLAVWGFDRLCKKPYAYISWETIKNNFKRGFMWDNDNLATNNFLHPYNGSLYFNAGRSNGFNYWQSELFAIFGSAMWEMCMENEIPSTNDIIATPIGGAAIGEVLYRASDLVLDDRSWGWERFGREAADFIISPIRGITRITTGRAWARRATTGRRFGTPPISVGLSLGARLLTYHDEVTTNRFGGLARIDIEYGDRFAERSLTPYDYFTFLIELNMMATQPVLSRIEIRGRLMSKELLDNKDHHLSIGMYQHFDYFDSDTITSRNPQGDRSPCIVPYKLGTPASVGAGLMYRYAELPNWSVNAYLHANGVILSGVLSDFYRQRNRNYNWSSGFSVKAGVNWAGRRRRLSFNAATQIYRLYTWKGYDVGDKLTLSPNGEAQNIQGDNSSATFAHVEARFNYRCWRNLYASIGVDWYHRYTYYNKWMEFIYNGTVSTLANPVIVSNQVGVYMMMTYEL